MTLYEINRELERLYMESVDPETGEINEEALDAIAQLELSRPEKIDNTACYIKSLKADAEAIKAEMETLKKRKERIEKQADSLSNYLERELAGEKFKSARCEISYRKSAKVILDDIAQIPEEYLRRSEKVELDKDKIKPLLKTGELIDGCHLEENVSMSIR